MGRQANNHTAFICIKVNSANLSDTSNAKQSLISFVLPIEIEVTKQAGLFL